jgi:ParB-like chromosome segregation protein Spo0J
MLKIRPIVVDENNIIIIGHARTEAAKRLGLETVPVIVKSDLDPVAIKKLRILDNKLSDLAEWDKENLKIELEDIGDPELTDLFDDLNLDMEDDPYK